MALNDAHEEHDACPCTHTTGLAATQSLKEVIFTSRNSIHDAVIKDDLARVIRLLQKKSSLVNSLDAAGYAPILYAKTVGMMEVLIRAGADVQCTTPEGMRTSLHRAAISGDTKLARILLDHGASSTKDREGQYPSNLATLHSHESLARLLASRPHPDHKSQAPN